MKKQVRESFSISYTSGKSIDELLDNIRKVYEENTTHIKEVKSIEVEVEDCYDVHSCVLNVVYEREETSVEKARRLRNEQAVVKYKRLQYEALKKEFGDTK